MSDNTAQFRFYEELNDFLPPSKRKKTFLYTFTDNPSIKDAVEAIGVPHTEIDLILVNSQSVDFHYRLQKGDVVSVYPVFESLDISPVIRLRGSPLRSTAFVLDSQLGKLARLLRSLGFDALYRNDYSDSEIIRISAHEKRIILTRDIGILKQKAVTHGYWIRSTSPEEQMKEVLERFDLTAQIRPFERCTVCNGLVRAVDKKKIIDRIPPKTKTYYNEFTRCQDCGKIYWKGSHYERMKNRITTWMNSPQK
ncbi:MAG: Mut7-C RNAse domain-containing protein [bacterium]